VFYEEKLCLRQQGISSTTEKRSGAKEQIQFVG
jgi:hypothetical protein